MGTGAWQKERRRTGSDIGDPRYCLPAAMDDRVGWRKRAKGRSTEVDLVVVVAVEVEVVVLMYGLMVVVESE